MSATSAMAWFVVAICAYRAVIQWLAGEPLLADDFFFAGLAGGAAYLAAALPRRVVPAWKACRQVAAAAGTINLVVLPSLVVACLLTIGVNLWRGVAVSPGDWTVTLAAAGAATALPWAFYYALDDPRVRSWFCVADVS